MVRGGRSQQLLDGDSFLLSSEFDFVVDVLGYLDVYLHNLTSQLPKKFHWSKNLHTVADGGAEITHIMSYDAGTAMYRYFQDTIIVWVTQCWTQPLDPDRQIAPAEEESQKPVNLIRSKCRQHAPALQDVLVLQCKSDRNVRLPGSGVK